MRVQPLLFAIIGTFLASDLWAQHAAKTPATIPLGAVIRVPPQMPPRMNIVSEILAWPQPPQASRSISLLTFSRDGKQLAISTADQSIRVVDASSGKEIASTTKRDRHTHLLRYTEDGQLLAVSSTWKDGDQRLSVWNVLADKTVREFTVLRSKPSKDLPLIPLGVGHIVLSPDGRLLAGEVYTKQGRRSIGIWDFANKKEEAKLLIPNEYAPGPYTFSPDSKWLVSNGFDVSPVRLWDMTTGKELCKVGGLQDRTHQFVFTPDGQAMATTLTNDTIGLWQVPSGKEIRRFQGHEQWAANLAFSPNGLTMVSGSEDKTVRLWDVVTGKQIRVWSGHETAAGPVAFSPDGRKVASGSFDGTVFVWDVTTAAGLPEISAQDLERLWDDLGCLDGDKAHRALWTLVAQPRESLLFLKRRLTTVGVPDDRKIDQLINDLSDGQFAKRQQALRQLEEIVDIAEPKLRAALKAGAQTLEGRRRIESLMDDLAETAPRRLRQRRAVGVLEAIATAEAKAILESCSAGPKESRVTRESRAALNRLENAGLK